MIAQGFPFSSVYTLLTFHWMDDKVGQSFCNILPLFWNIKGTFLCKGRVARPLEIAKRLRCLFVALYMYFLVDPTTYPKFSRFLGQKWGQRSKSLFEIGENWQKVRFYCQAQINAPIFKRVPLLNVEFGVGCGVHQKLHKQGYKKTP